MSVRSSFETTGKKRFSDLLLGTLRINVGDILPLKTLIVLRNIYLSFPLSLAGSDSMFLTQPCCLLRNRVTVRPLSCTELFAKPIWTVSSVSLNWIRIVKLFTRQWAVPLWLACAIVICATKCDLNGEHSNKNGRVQGLVRRVVNV